MKFFIYYFIFVFCAGIPTNSSADQINETGITREEDSKISPAPPGKVRVFITNDKAIIQWEGTGSDRIRYYLIYKRCGKANWKKIERIKPFDKDIGVYNFFVKHGEGCDYAVSVIDVYGKESQKSIEIQN